MTVDRFRAELKSWGCLVKSWATELDYIGNGAFNKTAFSAQPPAATSKDKDWALPAMPSVTVHTATHDPVKLPHAIALTAAEFKKLLDAAFVRSVHLPAQYQHVVIVQGSPDTMVVRLPPRDVLEKSEKDIVDNGYGPLPSFYQGLYSLPQSPTPAPAPAAGAAKGPFVPTSKAARMELHAERIGDYTLNSCS
jgi:hypothetical protein